MDRRMGEEELLSFKVLIPFSESLKITLRMFISAKNMQPEDSRSTWSSHP